MEELIVNNETNKKEKSSDKYYLIISIIFLIFGSILTTNPGNIVKFISYIIGSILIIIGTIRVISFIIMRKKYQITKTSNIISGIILIIFGIIACIWGTTVETVIRIIIGAWILYCGITKLIYGLSIEQKKINPITIIAMLMIVIGLSAIMIKYIEFQILGILIIIYSVVDIIGYILSHKK